MEYTHSFDIVIRSILIWVIHSPILFRDASLAVGQLYDCPSASEATLKNVGKIDVYQTTIMRHLSIHLMSKLWCVLWTPWWKWQYILDQWNVRLATRPSQLHRSDCLGQQVIVCSGRVCFQPQLVQSGIKSYQIPYYISLFFGFEYGQGNFCKGGHISWIQWSGCLSLTQK